MLTEVYVLVRVIEKDEILVNVYDTERSAQYDNKSLYSGKGIIKKVEIEREPW